ncbi:MAG: precorrin-3B synthase [Alphaproteobacteria bacterium]
MSPVSNTLAKPSVQDRRSACPGLFRMAQARDGAICRLKLTFGTLTAGEARAIAAAAGAFGNGRIDITNRANLQIRGVRGDSANALTGALIDAGLGPLTDKGDDVRNVMINPLAGYDRARVDVRPLAGRLLARLQTDPAYQTLSPKFCLFVDGGETLAPVEHPHDVWLSAADPQSPDPHFCFGVAGIAPTAPHQPPALGIVGMERAFALTTALLDLFIEWNRQNPAASRLRHMLADIGAETLVGRLERRLGFAVNGSRCQSWRRSLPAPHGHLGVIHTANDPVCAVGAMPPLGRLDPGSLLALARIAENYGAGMLRLTPWQSVLLPDVAAVRAEDALAALAALGFRSDPAEPLATMISCSGAAGCASALAATRADGLRLAGLLRGLPGIPRIHMSGCAKSCAAPSAQPVTLVATAPGHYDIFLYATDGPSRFGTLWASNRTIEEAADLIGTNSGSGGPPHA